jgi:lipid II:glycine glycyltransferase (peptidoglycan interpeptide bridge formation enzyme)
VAVRHSLELASDAGAVHARLSSMHQRNIRKAVRAGVEIARGNAEGDIETFYQLHLRTRRRHGVPIQPRRFFRLLQRRVIEPGHGFVLTASVGGSPIASAVFLAWNGVLMYKYGASDERYWEHRPNNLLLWSAIKWGCENGYRSFDLGRSDLHDPGLRSFKSGWGASEEPLIHSGTALEREHARPIVEWALAAMIRRAHPWVSRALGELLYRYAA